MTIPQLSPFLSPTFEIGVLSVVGGDQWRTIEMVFYRLDGKDVVQQHLSFRTLAEWSGHRR